MANLVASSLAKYIDVISYIPLFYVLLFVQHSKSFSSIYFISGCLEKICPAWYKWNLCPIFIPCILQRSVLITNCHMKLSLKLRSCPTLNICYFNFCSKTLQHYSEHVHLPTCIHKKKSYLYYPYSIFRLPLNKIR